MNLLVIDVGTSSIRGVLFDENGKELFVHQIEYDVIYQSEILAEQNPSDWENSLYEIARKAVEFAKVRGIAIDALSMTSQRSSVIAVDEQGKALRNAIMWQDKRNSGIVKELKAHEEFIFAKTAAHLNTVFSGSKMTWIKRNEPEIYQKAYKLLTIADFLTHLMTGEFRTDHTYGSRSLLMDIRTRQWDDELLRLFEVDREKLCDLVSPGSVIGHITEEFAAITGIPAGIPLISGGGDQQSAALGHGLTGTGTMEITTGTGAYILAFCDQVPRDLHPDVICGAHVIPGKYVLESSMVTCASLYNWLYRNFYDDGTPGRKFEKMNEMVLSSPAGCNGCVALPYFQGRGTPDWNSGARGGFMNVTLNTTLADMTRSILEAIAYEACNNVEVLERYAGKASRIYIGGGLTMFSAFNQMQADIYQRELMRFEDSEQTVLGAWANAAVTLGMFADYDEALSRAKEGVGYRVYTPDSGFYGIYQKQRAEMNRIYQSVYGALV